MKIIHSFGKFKIKAHVTEILIWDNILKFLLKRFVVNCYIFIQFYTLYTFYDILISTQRISKSD